jgi:hypothetical protein
VVCAALFTLPACEEEESYPYDLVESISQVGSSTQWFIYDCQNRAIRSETEDAGYFTADYGLGQVIMTSYLSINNQLISDTVFLTADGYLTYFAGSNCTYNTDGRLVSLQSVEDSATTIYYFQYSDGNLIAEGYLGQAPLYTYTYLTDKIETRKVGFEMLLGKPSYNLVSTKTEHGNSSSVYTFTYTFDSCNRVATETKTESGSLYIEVKSYTYID